MADDGKKWDMPKDARESGEKYPNYNLTRTNSGHVIQVDDSKDAESITIQHRSGSLLQFQPDGSLVFRNEKNKYEVVFGDNKVMITGCQDITVNGGASLKVEGDYDMTINGNMKTAVKGNIETVCNGNINTLVKGNIDTAVDGGETVKVKGNYEHTSEGKSYIGADAGLRAEATGGAADLIASSKATIKGATVDSLADGASVIRGATIDLN